MPKPLDELLVALARPDVSEFALMAGRLPCVKIGESYKPVDDYPPTNDEILMWMASAGGAAQARSVGETPVRFGLNVVRVGPVTVTAVKRNDVVQVRVVRGEYVAKPATTAQSAANAASLGGASAAAAAMGTLAAATVGPRAEPGKGVELDMSGPGAMPLELDGPAKAPQRPPPAARPSPQSPPTATTTGPATAPATGPATAPAEPPRRAFTRPKTSDPLESLLADARESRASDLHLVAERPPLFRIAGDLRPRGETLSPEDVERLMFPRINTRLRTMLDQTGSCDFALTIAGLGRMRVNLSKQRTGLKACFRLIDDEVPTLASLGLPEAIAGATHHHQGLIVVTGPTGHGKTSTLAAIVDIINRETTHHVITVEDPIEYLHPRKKAMISQREVGTHTRTFASALKGSLRQDPEVIVVGELRDTETVRMALSASETGHLVISTMNTPSAAKTIDRLIDLFPPGDQPQVRLTLAGGLRLVVSQRLVPNVDRTGLVAAAELLPGSIALWNLIRDNKTYQIPSLQQRGKALGIVRLDDSLAELVRAGKTTLEEARGWAEAPEAFEALVKGEGLVSKMGGDKPAPKAGDAAGGLFQKAGNLFKKGG